MASVEMGCSSTSANEPRALPRRADAEVRYVALGDSTVEGIGASTPEQNYVSRTLRRLQPHYPRATLLNLGVGGATSADVLVAQLDRAIAEHPELVTLSIGPNDLTREIGVEIYEAHLQQIVDRLIAETDAVLVVTLLPDLALAPTFTPEEAEVVGERTLRFNEAIQRVVAGKDVELVDLYARSQAEGARPELIAEDGYHPSDEGYALWADTVWPVIERRIPADRG
jgi:acyl-CoA thioesterase I